MIVSALGVPLDLDTQMLVDQKNTISTYALTQFEPNLPGPTMLDQSRQNLKENFLYIDVEFCNFQASKSFWHRHCPCLTYQLLWVENKFEIRST